MHQVVAQSAALRVSSPAVVDIVIAADAAAAVVAAVMAIAKPGKCIAPRAQAVAKRPRCLFSRVKTGPSIAATATSRKAQAAPITTAARAGSSGDRNFGASRRSFEFVLKRFKRKVQEAGILSEARRRRHFESPQDRRKRKAEAQRRRRRRAH